MTATNKRVWAAVVGIALALASVGGCRRKGASQSHVRAVAADASSAGARDAGGPRALRRKPKSQRELPTTSAEIYLANLDAQIEELTRLLKERPDHVANLMKLSGALHTRARIRGDVDEIQRGIDQASACVRLEPQSAACLLLRAEQSQSLHRFKESRADLAHAKALGADPKRVAELEGELDWNDGRYEAAISAIRRLRIAHPSTATWLREAQLEHALGRPEEAEAAFEEAEDRVRDTGPLVVAHLNLQRGIQKAELGRLEEACVFFREAVSRLPTYVAALEHLAEALHELGRNQEATRLYEQVVGLSDDPEFSHALAGLYAAAGKKVDASALEAKASARYEALLAKMPEAMYWHASEFYLETGAPRRALELLQKNVALRPNSASFVALANAELVNGRAEEAKRSIDKALAMPVVSTTLFAIAANIYAKNGDAASAARFRERARAMGHADGSLDAGP